MESGLNYKIIVSMDNNFGRWPLTKDNKIMWWVNYTRPESTNEEQSHQLLGVPGDDQVISNIFPAIIFRSVETA